MILKSLSPSTILTVMVLGERDFNIIYVSASASFSIDYNGKIIRIKWKRNNKSLSPSTIYDTCHLMIVLGERDLLFRFHLILIILPL